MDLVVANNGGPPLLLHNSGGNGNHFLHLKLVGTKSNRDAMGARVRVVPGESRRFARLPAAAAISRRAICAPVSGSAKRRPQRPSRFSGPVDWVRCFEM